MRVDNRQLHGLLSDAIRELKETRDAGPLLVVGRLLFQPPLSAVTSSVRAGMFRGAADVERSLTEQSASVLAKRADDIRANLGAFDVSALPPAQADLATARKLAAQLHTDLSAKTLGDAQCRNSDELKRLTGSLAANEPTKPSVATAAMQMAERLCADMHEEYGRARDWADMARRVDVTSALDAFEKFYGGAFSVFEGRTVPTQRPLSPDALTKLMDPVRRLAQAVLRELALKTEVHSSVMRLRVHLETFARDALLREMKDKKPDENFRNEEVLQRAMDGFLFLEGLFPLTHFDVSGGAVDTAFERRREAALEEVEALAAPPALIELKQVVKHDTENVTVAELQKAVEGAIAQAVIYRASLLAKWPDIAPYVVVAYDGEKRFFLSSPHARIVLVYLGKTIPSAKGKREAVDVAVPAAF